MALWIRAQKDTKTDELRMEDLGKYVIKDITGRTYWKGRDETPVEARWALYSIIIYANEYGQPKGQDLADGDPVSILYL